MSGDRRARATHVVAAAVIDRRGRVLIAQRPAGRHLAGLWEFPGGKVEPGETRAAALERELHEELGIDIGTARPLLRIRHVYPYGAVLLDVWVVRRYRGEPRGLEGQALRWCARSALAGAGLLPADRPIVAALRLPERLTARSTRGYRMTQGPVPGSRNGGGRLHGVLCRTAEEARRAAARGADFVALCVPLDGRALAALCGELAVPVFAAGVSVGRALELGASGVNRALGDRRVV